MGTALGQTLRKEGRPPPQACRVCRHRIRPSQGSPQGRHREDNQVRNSPADTNRQELCGFNRPGQPDSGQIC